MERKSVTFDEIAELFLFDTVPYIYSESEVPRLTFSFSDDAFSYFSYLSTHPYSYVSCINEKTFAKLNKKATDDVPSLVIKDYKLFFSTLTNIINKTLAISKYYNVSYSSARSLSLLIMRRIWLRLNAYDLTKSAEEFLQRQLSFLEHDFYFENNTDKVLAYFHEYLIKGKNNKTKTWDESNFYFSFYLSDGNTPCFTLPNVLYDITYQNKEMVCIISGVQNPNERIVDKKINRKLYELNKGIDDAKVHPSSMLSLIIFLNLLLKNNITKIIVPTLQILSYRYHELISETLKESYPKQYNEDYFKYIDTLPSDIKQMELEIYEKSKEKYNRFVDKEDIISKNKCENLLYMFYQLQDMGIVKITTEPFIESENLQVEIVNPREIRNVLARRM